MKTRNFRSLPHRVSPWGDFDKLILACVHKGRGWRVAGATCALWQRLYLFTDKTGWSSTWCDFPPGSVLVVGEVEL